MRRRNGVDDYVRALERRVVAANCDPTAVRELARIYERLGRGEDLREVVVSYRNDETSGLVTILVSAGHPLAGAGWLVTPDPHALENAIIFGLRAASIAATLEYPGYVNVELPNGFHLAIGYDGGDLGASLSDSQGNDFGGWAKEAGSRQTDLEWVLQTVSDIQGRIQRGEIVAGRPVHIETGAWRGGGSLSVVDEALAMFNARGAEANAWRMGGNIRAAGVARRLLPPGLHLYVTQDPTGEAQAMTVIGWDPPATGRQAEALLVSASNDDLIELAGDNTVVTTGGLERVLRTALRVVAMANPDVPCRCGHVAAGHQNLVDACPCGCERYRLA